jgi:plasmid stability protein
MKIRYHGTMTTILQVRDMPDVVVARLRERAERQGVSLSAYLRELLTWDAEQPTMAESIARIATRTPVEVSNE